MCVNARNVQHNIQWNIGWFLVVAKDFSQILVNSFPFHINWNANCYAWRVLFVSKHFNNTVCPLNSISNVNVAKWMKNAGFKIQASCKCCNKLNEIVIKRKSGKISFPTENQWTFLCMLLFGCYLKKVAFWEVETIWNPLILFFNDSHKIHKMRLASWKHVCYRGLKHQ